MIVFAGLCRDFPGIKTTFETNLQHGSNFQAKFKMEEEEKRKKQLCPKQQSSWPIFQHIFFSLSFNVGEDGRYDDVIPIRLSPPPPAMANYNG